MTADQYLQSLLGKITAPTGLTGPGERTRRALLPLVNEWAGEQLASFSVSGSYAKNTAIKGGTDVDLFISLKSNTGGTLAELYNKLADFLRGKGYVVRRQNVSIGITHSGLKVDLVPGKLQSAYGSDHSIYVSRQRTWKKTNIAKHVSVIGGSLRTPEIRILKRWRECHGIEFTSFALELAVLRALHGRSSNDLSGNVGAGLIFFRDSLPSAVLTDPANTANNVASDLTTTDKQAVATAARASLSQQNWGQIVW